MKRPLTSADGLHSLIEREIARFWARLPPLPPELREGACTNMPPETFFPPRGGPSASARARDVCNGCPVRDPCLEWALAANIEHGIWGGHTPRARRRLRRSAQPQGP
ncbi:MULTISPECIES: WhiB family transcriptional regulator [unclassified Nocardiopsis]|uniref:WhiB family transcriptional regulator n=1 Tax=unclassified Nocardiopsis TaxID=2649073 RepID=UPI001F2FE98C|nr:MULTISPECIES: WhiB family transcriptional regulator [unclassified Nocardiopsis]